MEWGKRVHLTLLEVVNAQLAFDAHLACLPSIQTFGKANAFAPAKSSQRIANKVKKQKTAHAKEQLAWAYSFPVTQAVSDRGWSFNGQ
jgi:hypothetical protein